MHLKTKPRILNKALSQTESTRWVTVFELDSKNSGLRDIGRKVHSRQRKY